MGSNCSNIDVEYDDLIYEIETPCYIIDEARLINNIKNLKRNFCDGWKQDVIFSYSVKTNSLPWIVSFMRKKDFYAEVVSEQEYMLAKRLGFSDKEIILNGPVKTTEVLIQALNGGAYVNLDNQREIDVIQDNISCQTCKWKVGLRYNFMLEDKCPGETIVGDEYSRFGFNVENGDFGLAVKRLQKLSSIRIAGLHGHNSTKSKSLKIFMTISEKAVELIRNYNLDLEYIDIGGGFFGDKPGTPTYLEYVNVIAAPFKSYSDIKLIIEPGASIVSSPISYLCEVQNIRDVADKRFVTVDGSMIHTDPLMHGINFRKKLFLKHERKRFYGRQTLCGFTCIEMDRMGYIEDEMNLQVGDRVEFLNCGSYTMALTPLFIRYFPTVYIYDERAFRCIRKEWNEENFIQNCEVLR